MTRLKWREFAMKPAEPGEYEVVKHGKTFLWVRVSDKPWGGIGMPAEKLATLESGLMVVVDPAPGPAEPAAGSGPAASPGPVPEVKVDEPVVPELGAVVEVAGRPVKMNPAMAAFMARQGPGPAVVDEPGAGTEEAAEEPGPGYAVPPDGFDGLSAYEQKKWVERNWGDLEAKHGELAEEAKNERLAECRVRAGRRKL